MDDLEVSVRVLLVEDSRTHARIISKLLHHDEELERFDVTTVGTLDEGVEAATSADYDVVLLDLNLPDSHGPETFAAFAARAPDLPVVVMTGIDDEAMAARLVHEGAQDFLVKSQTTPRLVRTAIRYARDRHATERSLREAKAAAEQATARMQDFASMATHELLSPMTTVQGFLQLLAGRWSEMDEDQITEQLGIVARQTDNVVRLVRTLLSYARLEAGELTAQPQPIALRALLEDVVAGFRLRQPAIELAAMPNDLLVMAEPDHLRSIVTNLLSNADKYGEPPIVVSAHDVRGRIEIGVTDHGSGVPDVFQPRLFERFARSDDAGSRAAGTGVGLHVVQGLAQANNGDVRYEPAPHGGACFVVTLPRPDQWDQLIAAE